MSLHTHYCDACGTSYTPDPNAGIASEDCPRCGFDGIGDPREHRMADPGPAPVSRDTDAFRLICEVPSHAGSVRGVLSVVTNNTSYLLLACDNGVFRVNADTGGYDRLVPERGP